MPQPSREIRNSEALVVGFRHMADDEFEWRPRSAKGRSGVALAGLILAACVAAGGALSWFLPIEKLVVAIERNGVPSSPAEPTSVAAAPSEILAAAPSPAPQPEPSPQVVVINRGTARAAAPDAPSASPPEKGLAPRPGNSIAMWRPAPQPSARHRNTNDRPVLVVVRRKGPPYDTKILRGRISNGRLTVDSRGLVIR
jgi:hypothetical protein